MGIDRLTHIQHVFLRIAICSAVIELILFSFPQSEEAQPGATPGEQFEERAIVQQPRQQVGIQTIAPNGQLGQCGPYYLWYYVSPDKRYPGDYVDLCGITFDVTNVVDDFDFVYFTDTPSAQRALLDKNRDGISDQYFVGTCEEPLPNPQSTPTPQSIPNPLPTPPAPNLLEWKPALGCVRVYFRDCWGNPFNKNCGYAMIHIQPKPGIPNGSARIPVNVSKKCPPNGFDCSETLEIRHTYSDCGIPLLPNFLVQKSVDQVFFESGTEPDVTYTIVVHNTGDKKGDTVLTDTISQGTKGGTLILSRINIECPSHARCMMLNMTNEQFQISLVGLSPNNIARIYYTRTGNRQDISQDDVSYFTDTATLSNGNSSQATIGIKGSGQHPPRPERPKPPDYTRP
jgi:uncharacterized repeat protein (TIGR01451 family)